MTRRAYNTAVAVDKSVKTKEGHVWDRVVESANEVKRDKLGRPIIKVNEKDRLYHPTRGITAAKKQIARQIECEGGIDWVLAVPQAIRDSGIRDYEKAAASGKAKNEKKRTSGEGQVEEKFKFRTRKDSTQTFELNARDFNRASGKIKSLFELMRTRKECLPAKAECAVRVQMDKLGRVFLCFVREVEMKGENQSPSRDGSFHGTAALDPGVRTFQAIYDADGQGIEWGKEDMTEIFRLCRIADGVQSKIQRKRATWSLRRAYHRSSQNQGQDQGVPPQARPVPL